MPKSDAAPTWTGQQFVQADRAGNVYFLRTDTFAVYRLTKQKTFDEPVRLETAVDHPGSVYGAAMSLSGDRWLVQDAKSARLFTEGKEQPVPPLPYKPWSVASAVSLVAVVPLFIRGGASTSRSSGTPRGFSALAATNGIPW